MLHGAAVNVPLARCERQGREHVEGLITIRIIFAEQYPLRHRTAVLSPADPDGRWVEVIRKADEAVFYSQLNVVCGVEDRVRRLCGGRKDKDKPLSVGYQLLHY